MTSICCSHYTIANFCAIHLKTDCFSPFSSVIDYLSSFGLLFWTPQSVMRAFVTSFVIVRFIISGSLTRNSVQSFTFLSLILETIRIPYWTSSCYWINANATSLETIRPTCPDIHHFSTIVPMGYYICTSLSFDRKNMESFSFFMYIYFSSTYFWDSLTVKSF